MQLLALAAVALATQTATLGPTTAMISWETRPYRSDLHVTIVRDGTRLVDEPAPGEQPQSPAGDQALLVRDLDRDGEPEVLVDAYSGGAHCCVTTLLWRFTGSDYARAAHDWGNQGYRLRDFNRDRRLELAGFDDFAYAFGAYVESRSPILILDARLRDVTASFPAAVMRDLRGHRHAYAKARGHYNARPALAAYVADLYTLGRGPAARRVLARAQRRGWIKPVDRFDQGPFGRAYLRRLDGLLRERGYMSRNRESAVSTI